MLITVNCFHKCQKFLAYHKKWEILKDDLPKMKCTEMLPSPSTLKTNMKY